MNIRAVILDAYGTLLEVAPAPDDADARWQRLWHDMLQSPPPLGRLDFARACARAVAARHEAARARDIRFPEVSWLEVLSEVLPPFARLAPAAQEEFAFRQIQTSHTTRLAPEVPEILRELVRRRCLLGLASNAQAYTLRELSQALASAALGFDLFERDLCFWSFEHGFSKPAPQVFRILSTRLAARGIASHETLLIGDRRDNDVEPARAQGWQTWHLVQKPDAMDTPGMSGDWKAFATWWQQM